MYCPFVVDYHIAVDCYLVGLGDNHTEDSSWKIGLLMFVLSAGPMLWAQSNLRIYHHVHSGYHVRFDCRFGFHFGFPCVNVDVEGAAENYKYTVNYCFE